MNFISPSRGRITLEQMVADIIEYVHAEPDQIYHLIVGTDSQTTLQHTCFVTAVIIHRQGKGGRYYYVRQNERRQGNLRQRIYMETAFSLELADQLREALSVQGIFDLAVQIHMDVGYQGDTRELVREVTGLVLGSGFVACIKPYACGASNVADRYTK
ncbi:MAG: ribonuclease H-like YkuK family protein [Methylocystaceae bacterium]